MIPNSYSELLSGKNQVFNGKTWGFEQACQRNNNNIRKCLKFQEISEK